MKALVWGALTASALAFSFFGTLGDARAVTIHSYDGRNFNDFTHQTPPADAYTNLMSVDGYFTLNDPLLPNLSQVLITGSVLDFSFNDGRNTLSKANAA